MVNLINQIFEIERKSIENDIDLFERNFKRIAHEFEELGYFIENPLHKKFDERDTSIEAKIMSENASVITKVLKPIIYQKEENNPILLQKGIVIVE